MAMSQVDRDILRQVDPDSPDLIEEDDYLEEDYDEDEEEEEEEEIEGNTPIVIMPSLTPKPAPVPTPVPAPKSDRFSALAEAIVSVKAALPSAALIPVIQGILDATGDPFAADAANRLAAETPTSTLLEELLAIEALLDKAIEGYPALIAFFAPHRRALLFPKK